MPDHRGKITPIPCPTHSEVNTDSPELDEVRLISNAIATGATCSGELTELQEMLNAALCEAYTGFPLDPSWRAEVGPQELAEGLARRDWMFRVRVLQEIILMSMLATPTPPEIGPKIERYAEAMSLGEAILAQIHKFGPESYDAAVVDFARNGYAGDFTAHPRPVLHTDRDIGDGWGVVEDDPELAQQWQNLEKCPPWSLGRCVFDFYQSRGFIFPGLPGSAPPLLAQHDWVHVLADYGTTLENEIEVFGLIGRADDDPRGFSLLAMVIGLFETGMVTDAGGLFEADAGHLSSEGMATRLADALRRGAQAEPDGDTPTNFLAVDWFCYADLPVETVRERFSLPPKSAKAIAAGSVGPWDEAGFSEHQREQGRLSVIDPYREY